MLALGAAGPDRRHRSRRMRAARAGRRRDDRRAADIERRSAPTGSSSVLDADTRAQIAGAPPAARGRARRPRAGTARRPRRSSAGSSTRAASVAAALADRRTRADPLRRPARPVFTRLAERRAQLGDAVDVARPDPRRHRPARRRARRRRSAELPATLDAKSTRRSRRSPLSAARSIPALEQLRPVAERLPGALGRPPRPAPAAPGLLVDDSTTSPTAGRQPVAHLRGVLDRARAGVARRSTARSPTSMPIVARDRSQQGGHRAARRPLQRRLLHQRRQRPDPARASASSSRSTPRTSASRRAPPAPSARRLASTRSRR